jgi:hypothetical protein
MWKRFKAWISSFHRWKYSACRDFRTCSCCGVVEHHYEWEGAYWWGAIKFGDSTKPCCENIYPFITPPY